MVDLVIYHADCWDGVGAAWVAKQALPDAIFHPGIHDEEPPDVAGHDVLILDFSYKRPIIEKLQQSAKSFSLIDHHDTAQKELTGLPGCFFDLGRSGVGLAWDCLIGGERPWIISYIEDRDLWRFKLPYSEAINAGLSCYPKNFGTFDLMAAVNWNWEADAELPDQIHELVIVGAPIVDYRNQLINTIIKQMKIITFEGHRVPIVNTTVLQSEIGARLAEDHPLSLTWYYDSSGNYVYSLRSKSIDVGVIARKMGGGGHLLSSGFRLKYLII